ncbi:hypothetical protein [Pyrofollis japonicus]|nr:hypothetical protein [Pyrofollis japonicus]
MPRQQVREETLHAEELHRGILEELLYMSEQLGKPVGRLLRRIFERI